MNIITRCHFKKWLRYVPFPIANPYASSNLSSFLNPENLKKYENKYRLLHTCPNLLAGHSKWSNIKHVKGAKDSEKSLTFSKYVRLIKIACKESGGTNPKLNFKLAKVIEQAKSTNMPMSTIEAALKSAEKSEDNAKPASVVFSAPGGIFVIVDVLTESLNRTRSELTSIGKKVNLKEQRGSIDGVFEEKGIVVTSGDYNKAVDHAIEVGAEDVSEEEGMLTFTCDPTDFLSIRQKIEDLNYKIEYASVEYIPNIVATIKENDLPKFKLAFTKFENHQEVIKMHTNFDL